MPLFHSLNQPLTSIRIALELCLMQRLQADEYREYLGKALEQSERLTNLLSRIQELLDSES